jgi:glutamate-1-semialdehyde 2,1-aminomutase
VKLLVTEWENFTKSTFASGIESTLAKATVPMGVVSSFQYWDPYPISIVSAKGAYMTDVDGRQLLDLSMGFGALTPK